jgi:putative membrane protein
MIRMLIGALIRLIANAVGLLVADVLLDDMSLDFSGFILAVAIFTIVEVLAEPFFRQMADERARFLSGGTALVTTFVGLLITAGVSDGFDIDGLGTWLVATVVVWLASMVAALLLPIFVFEKAVDEVRD